MGGYLPFSYSEIDAYCRLKGIYSLGDRERLLHFLELLDAEWIKAYVERENKKNPSSKGSSPPPSHSPPRGGGRKASPRTQVA
jgi:hypothetical protein